MKIKNMLRKNGKWIVALLGILICICVASGFISSRSAAHDANPIQGVNSKRSQVLLTGKDYTLNHKQEQQQKKIQKQQKKEIEENKQSSKKDYSRTKATKTSNKKETKTSSEEAKNQNTDSKNGSGSGAQKGASSVTPGKENATKSDQPNESKKPAEQISTRGSQTDDGSGQKPSESIKPTIQTTEQTTEQTTTPESTTKEPETTKPEVDKQPVITCSLKNGQHVSGSEVTVTVKARDYKYNYLNAFRLQFYLNGERISSSGDTNHSILYRCQDLKNGANSVTVIATDEEGNSSTASYSFTADTSADRQQGGTITFTMEANVLHLGVMISKKVDFYKGESMADIILRACESSGYQVDYEKKTSQGFYIKRIRKQGITNGWSISQEMKDELGITDTTDLVYDQNSLGEKDFARYSGWIYSVNGAYLGGMSTVIAEDGDNVVFSYTLNGY